MIKYLFALLPLLCAVVAAENTRLSSHLLEKAYSEIIGNASYVLGWQLAGSQQSEASLKMTCNNMTWLDHGRYAEIGMMSDYIQEPFCDTKDSIPDPCNAVPHVNACNTEMFISQVLYAFGSNSSAHFAWLCSNLDHQALLSFDLNPHRIGNVICESVSVPSTPAPYARISNTAKSSISDFCSANMLNLTSTLFATQYALTAPTALDRLLLCTQYDYVAVLQSREGINATIVRNAVCDVGTPVLGVRVASDIIRQLRSEIFVLQLLGAADAIGDAEKRGYLCSCVHVEGMGELGMDEDVVKEGFCG